MPASRQGAGKMCLARRGAPQVPYAGLSVGGARLRKLLVGAGLPLPLPVGCPPALAACCWRRAWRTSPRSGRPRARSWPSYVWRWEPLERVLLWARPAFCYAPSVCVHTLLSWQCGLGEACRTGDPCVRSAHMLPSRGGAKI